MKKKIRINKGNGIEEEKQISYIPVRYILAMLLTLLETSTVLAIVILLTIYVPFFFIAVILTQVGVVIAIINSNDNPDYKLPWLIFVIVLPVIGFMLYFLFYRRKLSKKYMKRLKKSNEFLCHEDPKPLVNMKEENKLQYSTAFELCNIASTHVYNHTKTTYYPLGELAYQAMLEDLRNAKKFILIEYFIIEEGTFWNSILSILKEKVKEGLEVKVMYDDIGCIMTLPGNYYKLLRKEGVDAIPFAKLRGQADSEFNNRSHRKIMVIDGKVGYTGGINIADEYINKVVKFGHWKDVGIRLEGDAVIELTKMFFCDYQIYKDIPDFNSNKYIMNSELSSDGYVIPFGDGPHPIYQKRVGKIMIMNMLNQATKYVYITTPYLIVDNELLMCIENTALRGIDVRIITPHIPDKKLILSMTRSSYKNLILAGVKIYEYEPGFIHAKTYISDDEVAIIGTINLDYRSLVHHFENGIWMYKTSSILEMKTDFIETQNISININENPIKENVFARIIKIFVKVFSPLL